MTFVACTAGLITNVMSSVGRGACEGARFRRYTLSFDLDRKYAPDSCMFHMCLWYVVHMAGGGIYCSHVWCVVILGLCTFRRLYHFRFFFAAATFVLLILSLFTTMSASDGKTAVAWICD